MYISIFLKKTLITILFISQISSFAKYEKILSANDFKKTISKTKNCLIYAFNGSLINQQNQSLYNDHLETERLLNDFFENGHKISRRKIVYAFSFDYSLAETKNIASEYELQGTSYILCFNDGKLSYNASIEGYMQENDIDDILYDAFSKTKFHKKRWDRKTESYDEYDNDKRRVEKVYIVEKDSYSEPRVGINFGYGAPYWDWPGYWYGRPWFGGSRRHHHRPRIGFGIGFGI
jgi:hypothetical protein